MKQKTDTVEERLKKMRSGYDQHPELIYGLLHIPCRIMNASEEARVIAAAKNNFKAPTENDRKYSEGPEIMKAVLETGCTVDGVQHADREFLKELSSAELEELHDQYIGVLRTSNPTLQALSQDQIVEIITEVKKKEKASSDFYTYQLAAIGRYFLDRILPMASDAGSN
jgi:hypothetical protein